MPIHNIRRDSKVIQRCTPRCVAPIPVPFFLHHLSPRVMFIISFLIFLPMSVQTRTSKCSLTFSSSTLRNSVLPFPLNILEICSQGAPDILWLCELQNIPFFVCTLVYKPVPAKGQVVISSLPLSQCYNSHLCRCMWTINT